MGPVKIRSVNFHSVMAITALNLHDGSTGVNTLKLLLTTKSTMV